MRLRSAFLVAAALLVGSAIAGVAQPQLGRSALPATKTITVTGEGTVQTLPDRASFDFTVDSRAQTAAGAIARASDAATAVGQALKSAGVAAADLRTSQVSLSPQTNQDGTRIVGYAAAITLSATTGIVKAGALVDAGVKAGADAVSGPNMTRSDADTLYRTALRNAVADATDKASALASAGGLTLGSVQSLAEGTAQAPVPFAAAKADAGPSVPIEPGTQTVDATVTVTFNATG